MVTASSINALGFNFGIKSFPIQYFPLDEAHPSFTTDAYSFSKQIIEEVAAYYWRQGGHFGGVFPPAVGVRSGRRRLGRRVKISLISRQQAFAELLALPGGRTNRAHPAGVQAARYLAHQPHDRAAL